ncbi:MAG: hypothetical protein EA400_14265 [Chromatiaceae bacterium]|nr:MAG: hypothetical protein EA400_14265 [Chromatiaceae bacterium]
MSGLVDLITFELPEHWTPAQALAVDEALEAFSQALWAYYGAQMQALIAEETCRNEQLELLDPDDPLPF